MPLWHILGQSALGPSTGFTSWLHSTSGFKRGPWVRGSDHETFLSFHLCPQLCVLGTAPWQSSSLSGALQILKRLRSRLKHQPPPVWLAWAQPNQCFFPWRWRDQELFSLHPPTPICSPSLVHEAGAGATIRDMSGPNSGLLCFYPIQGPRMG